MRIELDEQEQRWLSGADGAAMALAMQLMVAAADVSGATRFVQIEMAHINSCHYSGQMSLDFAEFLLAEGATLSVPTHTNASLISCSSPDVRPASATPETVANAERVMDIYEELGCSSMWSCAPYLQDEGRATFGQQIAGSESNAVGFANSALGARTNKYGDMLDMAAAMLGRVPYAGLHTDEGRRATDVLDLSGLPESTLADPNFPHLLGCILGRRVVTGIGAVVGIESIDEDGLKAVAAGAAAAGGVELFHIVGVTPEAPTLDAATQGVAPKAEHTVTEADLVEVMDMLTSASGDEPLRAVCVGTPHFSITEFAHVVEVLDGRRVSEGVTFLATTSRAVANELSLRNLDRVLAEAGVHVVLDTCTYYPPHPSGVDGLTLTNSAKWAYYGQGLLEVPIGFTSLERCVESAVAGRWV